MHVLRDVIAEGSAVCWSSQFYYLNRCPLCLVCSAEQMVSRKDHQARGLQPSDDGYLTSFPELLITCFMHFNEMLKSSPFFNLSLLLDVLLKLAKCAVFWSDHQTTHPETTPSFFAPVKSSKGLRSPPHPTIST